MAVCGGVLIFLAVPLWLGYFIGEQKNVSWRNLGLIMGIIGLLIIVLGSLSGQ